MGGVKNHLTYRLMLPLIAGYLVCLALAFALINNQADTIRASLVMQRAGELAESFLLAIESNPTDAEISRVTLSMSTFKDVAQIYVLEDDDKTILAASNPNLANRPIDLISQQELRAHLLDASISKTSLLHQSQAGDYLFSYKLPLFYRDGGALRDLTFFVQVQERAVAQIHSENARTLQVGVSISLAVVIILMFLLIRRHILRPLSKLSRAINQGKAEGEPILVEFSSPDEIGTLIDTYNEMILTLHQRQIELEKAKQGSEAAARSKSNFLSSMTHEIRTPLNGVLGLNQLLRQTDLNREQSEFVKLIDSSGKQLLAIVNDILDFSRIEANRLTLSLNPLDVELMMQDIYAIFKVTADEKAIGLALTVPPNIPQVLADGVRLRQVLINLIGNALKFTRQGSVAINLSTREMRNDKLVMTFQVRDSGIGIRAEDQARLFDKFTQADSSIVREFGGSGLGLTISRQLVDLMGGRLWVESEWGQGSTFFVELTLPIVDMKTVVATADISRQPSSRQAKILIAEDTQVNRLILEKMLTSKGHTVVSVADGKQAVDKVVSEAFDIVLMDCQMPVMDGMLATREIRKTHPDLPIVAVTAGVTEEIRQSCAEAGMDGFLTKPVNFAEVINTVDFWLEPANRRAGT